MSTNLEKVVPFSEKALDTVQSVSSESSSVNQVKVFSTSTPNLVVKEDLNEEVVQCKDNNGSSRIEIEEKEILVEQTQVVGMEKQEDEEGVLQVAETLGGGDSEAVLDGGNDKEERVSAEGENKERGCVEGENAERGSAEGENKERGVDLNLSQENPIDEASVEEEIEPESAGVTVSVGHLVDENLKPDVHVAGVESAEDEEREIAQVNGNCTKNDSLEEVDKRENFATVTETLRVDSHSLVENLDEGIRVTIDSSSVAVTESIVEQVQVVEGGEVAMMDCDALFETREEVPKTDAFAGNPSDNRSVEAQAVGGVESERDMALVDGDLASDVHMTEQNGSVEGRNTGIDIVEAGVSTGQTEVENQNTQVVDGDEDVEAQTACGSSKSTANGNLCSEDETSEQDGKQDTVALVGESVSHQVDGVEKMDSCPVNENLDDGVHATVDLSSLPDGSQLTDSERIIKNCGLGDGLPDISQENGAEINEMEGDTDFSVLVLDEELISDTMDVDNFEGQNIEIGDNFAGYEQRKSMEQQVVATETLEPEPTAEYDLIPGKDSEFSLQNPEDHTHPNNRKEKSLSDLMNMKKPDIDDHNHVDVDSTAPQSFKVGECIRRIASQLTGGPTILKSGSKNLQVKKYSCPDMLTKLRLAARDHKKGHGVLPVIGGFFSEFRNSGSLTCAGLKQRKKSEHMVGSAEPFDFEDTNDSYWTDRIVQNTSDEQAAEKNSERKEETVLEANPTHKDNVSQAPGNPPRLLVTKVVLGDGNKELTLSTRKNRKRKENSDQENPLHSSDPGPPTKKSSSRRSRKKKEPPLTPTDDNAIQLNDVQEKKGPTALLLRFTKPHPVPSGTNLSKIFRRFGPLKELETEVVKETNSAVVVFKTYNDAKVALSSAGKFSIFGQAVVSYELSSFPLPPPKKVSLYDITQGSDAVKLLQEASQCDTPQGGDDVKLLEDASLCDTTQGGDNVKVLEEAPLCDTIQGSHNVEVSEEAPICDTSQGSHDVKMSEEAPLCDTTHGTPDVKLLEEASLCDTTQVSHDVKLLEGNTT